MYLVDTNVVSETRRLRPHPAVLAWLRSTRSGELQVSALTIGEIQKGVEHLRDRDPIRASSIESWLDEAVLQQFEVLAFDSAAARQWARLMRGLSADLTIDAMIASTALVHGLTVVTRNERDFDRLVVPTLNPFEFIG